MTIGIAESGTGGRFGSLLLSEPSAADVVRGVVADASGPTPQPPVTWRVRRGSSSAAASGSVSRRRSRPAPRGCSRERSSSRSPGKVRVRNRFPIRAAYQEIQRRAALHAADVLRRALAAT